MAVLREDDLDFLEDLFSRLWLVTLRPSHDPLPYRKLHSMPWMLVYIKL